MQIEQIVALLVAERNRIEAAIHALRGPSKPAVSAPAQVAAAPARKKKRTLSAAGRKAIADAAKKRWAAVKAAKAAAPVAKGKGTAAKKG
ncbi:MAG: hypothetical protein WA213_02410 [Terriglobales bacterium]